MGVDVINGLLSNPNISLSIITQQTKRDEIYGYRSALDHCKKLGLKYSVVGQFDEDFYAYVKKISPDLIVCAYFPKIFPLRLLQIPPLGCINVHPGKLPSYRGTFPTPWCILNNENSFGVTLHYMDQGIDTGDILVQREFPILNDETGHELYKRAMRICASLLLDNIDGVLAGSIKRTPQVGCGSYYSKIEARHEINWNSPRKSILNQVRVHAEPYYPAYTFIFNRCILINKVELFDAPEYVSQTPGKIKEVFSDKSFLVSAADGLLKILDYKIAPEIDDLLFNLHIKIGNKLS
jgi:methionyl-tRNA formyltransferase